MKVRQSLFPLSMFAVYLGILLLMSGIHTSLFVVMEVLDCSKIIKIIVLIVYWTVVSVGITLFTRWKIKTTYEMPLHKMAEATAKVSRGDFSVHVPTVHTDRLDYLDVMIMDFNKMVQELGSIETLKTDFVSNVSHEMKTPISIVKSYAQLLKKEELSPQERIEYTQGIDHATSRLSNLIGNILKLNKLENQCISKPSIRYDLCRQLCDCVLMFEEVLDQKEIDLEVDMEDSAWITADQELMELVWSNLLSNAIKFTERKGTIRIIQRSKEEKVQVSITDTGCGISKESQKYIFDKFYQADTSHATEGNGLGLSLVKKVIELEDGLIDLESEIGKGSTFTITLQRKK